MNTMYFLWVVSSRIKDIVIIKRLKVYHLDFFVEYNNRQQTHLYDVAD